MPRRDNDPLKLGQNIRLYIDLGAERILIAERRAEKIAVEVKVFGSISPLTELQKSVGQYLLYRSLIKKQEPDRKVFLAISSDIYSSLFMTPEIVDYILELRISLLIFNPATEEIEQWIN
jgi:hypothetical protein